MKLNIFLQMNSNLANKWIIVSSIILLGIIIYFLVIRIISIASKKSGSGWMKSLNRRFKLPFLLVLITSAFKAISFLVKWDKHHTYVISHVFSILIIITIAVILVQIVNIITYALLSKYDIARQDNLQARKAYTQFNVLRRVASFIIVIIATGLVLMTFEKVRQIGLSLLASAGIAGIILGFAAQKFIATIIAGLQIAITQPIRINDAVTVENEFGRIEEIHLTYVVVKIWDERRLVIPTTYFIEKPFQNWTRTTSELLGFVYIYTDYTVPVNALRKALTDILKSSKYWNGKVNTLEVTDATERTIQARALMSANDSSDIWELRVEVREKMIAFLQKNYPEALPKVRLDISDKLQ